MSSDAGVDMARWDRTLEQTQEDTFWLPDYATRVERPELLYLKSERDLSLVNTVIRIRGDASALPSLVDEVSQAHARVTSRYLISPNNAHPAIHKLLHTHGYSPQHEHSGYVSPVESLEFARPLNTRFIARQVQDLRQLQDFEQVKGAVFGSSALTLSELERELTQCTGPAPRVWRFVTYELTTQAPVSCGAINLYPHLKFGFLWGGGTLAAARGQGAYAHILRARQLAAKTLGLDAVGLYARTGTSAPIVAAQGFIKCGPMIDWSRPAP